MNRVLIKIRKKNNILIKLSSYGINIYNVNNTKDYYLLEVLGSDLDPNFFRGNSLFYFCYKFNNGSKNNS